MHTDSIAPWLVTAPQLRSPGANAPRWLEALSNLRRLPEMARDPLAFFARVSAEQGPVASFDFALGRQWLISDPDAIKEVFVDHHDDLGKDAATMSLTPLLGRGLLTTEDDEWGRLRRAHGGLFRSRHIQHYGAQMVAAAQDAVPGAGRLDLLPAMNLITRRIMLEALFGKADGAATDIADAVDAYIDAHEREFMSWKRFLPAFVPTPARRQAARSRRVIADRMRTMVAQRRQGSHEDLDMLARLVAVRDPEGVGLSDQELCDTVATLCFGGTETSANALTFAIWRLAQRPEVQDALEEERQAVLGSRAPTASDVRALVRHGAVLDEAMRLFPPVWALGRKVLRSFEVRGHRIEAGDQLNASPWVVHRNRRFFPQPEAFRPERFWNGPDKSRPRTAFLPYGAGPRMCVGHHFARMETVLVLATWLSGRRVHPLPDRPMTVKPRVTLRPADGAWVYVEVCA